MADHPLYNASVRILKSNDRARVIRVYPDKPRIKYLPGQYGSLGLVSETDPEKLVRRAYCLSHSVVDPATERLIDFQDTDYFEFYFNRVAEGGGREGLTPKLFRLKDGDRIFCGEKIVGYYTLAGVPETADLLLIGTTTGESPNNSLTNQALLQRPGAKVCNVAVGPRDWTSLYAEEQDLLVRTFERYRYVPLKADGYEDLESRILRCLREPDFARDFLGFALSPTTCRVFLSGDPAMIGAPKKKGGWDYEYPNSGLIKTLIEYSFSIRTKFKEGTIEYEAYW